MGAGHFPEALAQEISGKLESALEQFAGISEELMK